MYLAKVKDLYTKEVVGYALNKRMTTDLVLAALNMAIKNKYLRFSLIVHSDRCSQYYSHDYRNVVEQHGFNGSMSARGNYYVNAPIESFSGILKNELVYDYEIRLEATTDIMKCTELEYNQTRIQKGLGMKSSRQVLFDYYRQAA